jgi:hypothetical protein
VNTFTNSNIDPREPMQKAFEEDCASLGLGMRFTLTSASSYLYAQTRTAYQLYRLGYERSVKDHK